MRSGWSILAALALTAACGSSVDPASVATTSRWGTAATAPPDPAREPTCTGGTELGVAITADGRTVHVVESRDHRLVCLGTSPSQPELTFNLDPDRPPSSDAPHPSNTGGSHGFGLVWSLLLPDGYPRPVTVRNERGDDLPSWISLDGRQLLVLETAVDTEAAPPAWVPRTFVVLDASGGEVDRLTFDGPPIADQPASPLQVLACLRAQGLHLPESPVLGPSGIEFPDPVDGTRPDHQPYAPGVAQAAWAACRDLARASMIGTGVTPTAADRGMDFLDCMAAHGWIQMFRGSDFDAAQHDVDARACSTPA